MAVSAPDLEGWRSMVQVLSDVADGLWPAQVRLEQVARALLERFHGPLADRFVSDWVQEATGLAGLIDSFGVEARSWSIALIAEGQPPATFSGPSGRMPDMLVVASGDEFGIDTDVAAAYVDESRRVVGQAETATDRVSDRRAGLSIPSTVVLPVYDAWSRYDAAAVRTNNHLSAVLEQLSQRSASRCVPAGPIHDVTAEIGERFDGAVGWGSDRFGDFAGGVGDVLIGGALGVDRSAQRLFNSGLIGVVSGRAFGGRVGGELGGITFRQVVAPRLRNWWNQEGSPRLVGRVFELVGDRINSDDMPRGDREARRPGGDFPVRTSGQQTGGPDRFVIENGTAVDIGRDSIVQALEDTANGDQIWADEFQIVAHESGSYTVVLPGVTDLTDPNAGLSHQHRSVRDTDWAAVRSAASASIDDNRYAQLVREYIHQNVPVGADLAIVGHSFGGDTALDLAADPAFNGEDYNVTHVVAAAYHSEPQLPHVQNDTSVLVLQNTRDIPVVIEEFGHASSPEEISPDIGNNIVVDEFTGGWAGAGHHQSNYIERVQSTTDERHEVFFADWAASGYGEDGEVTAVDVSIHG